GPWLLVGGHTAPSRGGFPLPDDAGLLVVPLLAQVFQDACLLDLSLELLERPVETISFVESDFNHRILGRNEWLSGSKEPSRCNRPGSFSRAIIYPARGLTPELDDVLGGRALGALDDVELDALTFGERPEALALDRRVMNEAVLLSAFGRDETEALRIV